MFKLVLFLLFTSYALSNDTLVNTGTDYPQLGMHLSVYEDPSALEDIKTIVEEKSNLFKPLNCIIDVHLPTSSAYWYSFDVLNPTPHTQNRILSFNEAWLNHVDVYYFQTFSQKKHLIGGDSQNFFERSVDATKINFSLELEEGKTRVYIRVQTGDPFLVNVALEKEISFMKRHADFLQEMTFIFGAILAMLFYNLFLFFSSRDKTYAYYVVYLISFLLLLASYNGLFFKHFLSQSPEINNYTPVIFMNLYMYAGIIFANVFLQTRLNHPKIYSFSMYLIFFFIITSLIANSVVGYSLAITMAIAYSGIFSIFIVSIALYAWRNNNQSARFFLLGSIAGLLGTSITAGTALGFIPFHHFTFTALDYGVLIDAILLSFALAEKLRVLQIQKMSAQKEAKEKALASEKLKDAFLSTMSHEIRTPLNAILGFVFILKKRMKEVHLKEYLDTIESSSNTLLNIVNDILDFSNIQNSKLYINNEAFDPHKELFKTTQLFEHILSMKNITFNNNISPNLPKTLKGDITRINQILFNLLSNAFKFTSHKPVINLDIDYSDGFLHIIVKDNGVGISPEIQSKIFNAFEQADLSTTREYGGMGLGLAISNRLAKLMNTKIDFRSELKEGSVFSIKIALEVSDVNLHEQSADELSFHGNVLIVEDNRTNQLLISILLDDYKISYDLANDGIEAFALYKCNKYDLILMDENMPNMNGLAAFEKIRDFEREANLPQTPIAALTADVAKEGVNKYLDAGMNDYLAKPIDNNEFERVLARFLKPCID